MSNFRTENILLWIITFHIILKFSQGQTFYFWIDLQKNGSIFYDRNGNVVTSPPTLSAVVSIGINQANQRLAFDGSSTTLKPIALDTITGADILCEQSSCPCGPNGWFMAGSKCYYFQSSGSLWPPSTTCNGGGALANDYNNIFTNWAIIQGAHPLYCGFGNYRPRSSSIGSFCLSYPQPAADWFSAEKDCMTRNGHIVSFTWSQQWTDFLNEYQNQMSQNQNCYNSKLWLGYSRYAWNSGSIYTSTNYQTDPYVRTDIVTGGGGDCVYYNLNPATPWSLQPCTNSERYICLKDSPKSAKCPTGWRYIPPYCYKFLNTTKNFASGQTACQADYSPSNLASFHNQDQWDEFNAFRTGYVNLWEFQMAKMFDDIYIGYQTPGGPIWSYTDNSDPSWAFWTSMPAPNPGTASCAISSRTANYTWTASDCTTPRGIICMGPVINSCFNTSYSDVDLQCYMYMNTTATTWDQAARLCNKWGGTLPIISKVASGNQKTQWSAGINGLKDNIWIGLTQYANQGSLQWMTRAWFVLSDDNNTWSSGYPEPTKPYVASLLANNYAWTTEPSTVVANVICHLQKPLVCPTVDFYEVPCGTNCYQCFLPSATMQNFGDGEDFCRSNDNSAHLIDYQTTAEWNAYRDLHYIFLAMLYPLTTFWVGYSRGPQSSNGPWVANHFGTPDAPLNLPFWKGSEPHGALNDGQHYCIFGDNLNNYSGMWMDDDCTLQHGVVCEIDTLNSFCPYTWGEYNGTDTTTCYKYFGDADFLTAQSTCLANGGSLPSFHSFFEWQDFLRFRWTLINTNHDAIATMVWLGLSDINNSPLKWMWQDGSNYNWSNWIPNNQPNPVNFNPNCVCSKNNPPADKDMMYWSTSSQTTTFSVICQMREIPLTNPCPVYMSDVGSQCVFPVADDANTYYHQQAYTKCGLMNYSLPTFPTQQSWVDFMSWFNNMNQAIQWTPIPGQKVWPMTSFWIGLSNFGTASSYVWDDGQSLAFNNFPGGVDTPAQTCYYAQNTMNYSWIQSGSCVNPTPIVPSLICQSGLPLRGRCANMYFAYQNNVCYMTVSLAPMDIFSARANCTSLSNGFLPSFHNIIDWDDFLQAINIAETVQALDTSNGIWLGLNDNSVPFMWQWENDMSYNWTNWMPNVEPSSVVSDSCVGAVKIGANNWQWERRSCSDNLAVICQSRTYNHSTCSPGYSDLNGDGNCYQVIPPSSLKSITHDQALFYCESLNGTLPCFANNNDWNNFLAWKTNFATSSNLNSTDFWLGLYNGDQTFASWLWTDSTPPPGFTFWLPSKPQQIGQSYCTASLQSSNYSWTNYDCTTKTINSLICKQNTKPSICPDNSWLQVGAICYNTILPVQTQNKASAQTACQTVGGNLPSFHSTQEFDEFTRLYSWYSEEKYGLNTQSGIWTGLSDVNTAFLWQWDDNSSYNWNYWDIGVEPSAVTSKKCVLSIKNNSGQYVWRRAYCNANAAVICQIRVPPLTTICSPGWSEIDGVCYRLWPGIKNLNSDQMEKFCELNDGTLPVFYSSQNWEDFLDWKQNTARSRNSQSNSFWLYCCDSPSNPWQWSNNAPGAFSNWSTSPNTEVSPFCSAALINHGFSWEKTDCASTFVDSAICMETIPPQAPTCPPPWMGVDNKCYLELTQPQNFSNALNLCPQTGNGFTSLPSFHHDGAFDNFNAIRWYFAAKENLNPISSPAVWIGANNQNEVQAYQFIDQSNFNWAYWKSGVEPVSITNDGCALSQSLDTNSQGRWTAVTCSSSQRVICQWRPQPLGDACGIPGWAQVRNRCYQIVPLSQNIDFYDANKTCNKLNATLPSFDSQLQWDQFLLWRDNFANTKLLNTTDFWLGAQYDNVSLIWNWTDYQVTSFTGWNNWLSSEPNDDQCGLSSISKNMTWIGRDCNTAQPSLICQLIQYPVDCQMTDWVNSTCAQTCDNSTLQSTRTIAQIDLNGGIPCPNDTLIVYDCLDQIPCPIDCQMTTWSDWSECDCSSTEDGTWQRSRSVKLQPEFDGEECPSSFESETCPDATCWPMTKAERIAAQVLQTIGCIWLLGICGGTVVLCMIFRIFSIERMLHAGQEICIIFSHLLILFFREKVKSKALCTISSAFIQFFTIGSYTFMLLESLQVYCIVTNVVSINILSWKFNLIAAFTPPFVITSISAAFFYNYYRAKYSCWLNIGHTICFGTIIPVLVCALTTIVLLEAAGMGHQYKRLPLVKVKKYTFNRVNQRGLLFVLPANLLVLFTGTSAIYYQDISSFTLVCVLLIFLGICIFVFHCISHAVLYLLFSKILSKLSCCKKKADDNKKDVIQPAELDSAKTITDVGSGEGDDRRRNRQYSDRFKDTEAFHKWVLDGRQDNMNISENLLFDKDS